MIFTGILFLILVIRTNIVYNKEQKEAKGTYYELNFSDRILANILPIVIFIFAFSFGTLISTDTTKNVITKTVQQNIVSLNRSNSLSGSGSSGFFISSGYINSEKVYTVMKKLDNGSFQETNIPQKTIIFEDTKNDNSYFTYEICDLEKSTAWFLITWQTKPYCPSDTQATNYILHIPQNTIISEFNIK
jgi:hypothetical protein